MVEYCNPPLTIDAIMEAIDSLKKKHPFAGFKIVTHPLLRGNEVAIRSGDKLYVCPDFTQPEKMTVITVPDLETELRKIEMPKLDDSWPWRFSRSFM